MLDVSVNPGNPTPSVAPRPTTATSQKCEYRRKCERFIQSLNISGMRNTTVMRSTAD
jgi:hypothetical protein